MNIEEINNTIIELENGATTFDACQKLASLYIVRDRLGTDVVKEEYLDILPSYNKYVETKRQYQLDNLSIESVIKYLNSLKSEIIEFLHVLYVTANSQEEKQILEDFKNF